jgi:hypothetical protein
MIHGNKDNRRLAQSASALGAGLIGFGLGAYFGTGINHFILLFVIVFGSIIHIAGMYIMQMKDITAKTGVITKTLWLTAWLCLLSLIALVIYLLNK